MTTPSLTTEQKLAAVIEAQERGGHNRWSVWKDTVRMYGNPAAENVLACLLDPKGLRAAYAPQGTEECVVDKGGGNVTRYTRRIPYQGAVKKASYAILNAWLSGGAEAAIDTAHSLLPTP